MSGNTCLLTKEADEAFKAILSILAMERPYSRIKELRNF